MALPQPLLRLSGGSRHALSAPSTRSQVLKKTMAGSKRRRKQVDATPRKEGRVSARLQSLYSPTDQPQTPVVDFVRAGMPFKARKWVKSTKRFGGEGPQGFAVPRWAPVGEATPELQAIKLNPAPRHKGWKKSPRSPHHQH